MNPKVLYKSSNIKQIARIVAAIAFFIVGCQIGISPAERAIQNYLKGSMNDFGTYSPVEFSPVDTLYVPFDSSALYRDMNHQQESFAMSSDRFRSEGNYEAALRYRRKADSLLLTMAQVRDNFPKKISGYKMTHKFRGSNAIGVTVINVVDFYFDTSLNIVRTESY